MSTWERMVLGYPIRVRAERLDEGWDVSITGGVKTHVGAVTLAEPGGEERTLERLGHRDSHISRLWAARLAEGWDTPVCVRCGIHYDGATKAQIAEIIAACQDLLEQVLAEAPQI